MNTVNETPKVAMTNEIVNAILYSEVDVATAQRAVNGEVDLHDAIYTQMNVNISRDISFDFVANEDNTVNLILPYYESIEDQRAKMIGDEELGEVVGGELFIIAIIAGMSAGAIIGGAVAATWTTGAIVGAVVGGVLAGVAVASIYIGGAVGGSLQQFDASRGATHLSSNASAPGYSDLASAAKTGNSLLGV